VSPNPKAKRQRAQALDNRRILQKHARTIRALAKRTVKDVVAIGRLLSDARQRMAHGEWYHWLGKELGWSPDTAANFINVYELSRQTKTRNFRGLAAKLPPSTLYLLARKSTPDTARDEVFRRVTAGEKLSIDRVKTLVAKVAVTRETVVVPCYRVETEPSKPARQLEREREADLVIGCMRRLAEAVGDKYATADDLAELVDRTPHDELLDYLDSIEQFARLAREAMAEDLPHITAADRPPEMPEDMGDVTEIKKGETKH